MPLTTINDEASALRAWLLFVAKLRARSANKKMTRTLSVNGIPSSELVLQLRNSMLLGMYEYNHSAPHVTAQHQTQGFENNLPNGRTYRERKESCQNRDSKACERDRSTLLGGNCEKWSTPSLRTMFTDLFSQTRTRPRKILKDSKRVGHFVRLFNESVRNSCPYLGIIHNGAFLAARPERNKSFTLYIPQNPTQANKKTNATEKNCHYLDEWVCANY